MRTFSLCMALAVVLAVIVPSAPAATNTQKNGGHLTLAQGQGSQITVSARGKAFLIVQGTSDFTSEDSLLVAANNGAVATAKTIKTLGKFAMIEVDALSYKAARTELIVSDGKESAHITINVVSASPVEIAQAQSVNSPPPTFAPQAASTSKTPAPQCSLVTASSFVVSPAALRLNSGQTSSLTIALSVPTPSATPSQIIDQVSTPMPSPSVTPSPVPIVGSDNVAVLAVPSPATLSAGTSGIFTVGVAAYRPGSACLSVSVNGEKQLVPVNVIPRQFALSAGIGFDFDGTSNQYTQSVAGPSPAATRIVETSHTEAQVNGMVLGHYAITHHPNSVNWWGTIGTSSNTQGLVYGISLSPAHSDTLFATLGLRQNTSQELLPGLAPGQIVPTGVTAITLDHKRPVVFFGITGDLSQLGCIFAAITSTGSASLSSCKSP